MNRIGYSLLFIRDMQALNPNAKQDKPNALKSAELYSSFIPFLSNEPITLPVIIVHVFIIVPIICIVFYVYYPKKPCEGNLCI